MTEPLLLDVGEVAALLGVGRTFVYELLKEELPSCKLGARTKIPAEAVRAYVDRCLAEAVAERERMVATLRARRAGSRASASERPAR